MKTKYKAVLRWTTNKPVETVALLSATPSGLSHEQGYYLLPATPEAYEAQVEAMRMVLHRHYQTDTFTRLAERQSAAIGIKRPKSVPPATADRKGGT